MTKQHTITIAVMAAIALLLAALILKPRADDGRTDADAGHAGHGAGAATAASSAASALETITLSEAQIKAAGVVVAAAAPAPISTILTLPGEIRFNDDRTAHVVPKLAGVVVAVHAQLGQSVQRGQLLAVLASSALSEQRSELLTAQKRLALASTTLERERQLWQDKISAEQDYLHARQAAAEAELALQNARQKLSVLGAGAVPGSQLNQLELRAPFAGVVMEKHLALGEAIKEDANVFTISDLATVWADFAVPPQDLNRVRVGDAVTVRATAFAAQAEGTIGYVGALLGEQTRSANARVALANPARAWRPGLFVNVEVQAGRSEAAVTVAADAVQTVDGQPAVFVRNAGGFQVQPVVLGRSDGQRTEILQGLPAGARYAAANSYVLKAELGKDGAEHAH
ncbi:membrane fusion protein, cobalt-zinc-cadmium efflux system [Duganella sp. CF402]|uniref:efflux RND transporter periplasmic adaptor subunit n=1 Tax=unclassified Duganella TaxID=2636909 RepID=UPI0008BF3170|nr:MULTISPECIES: efflux RND transporter periplasmic adaptor subunit [unclassified Duganella]RZT05423.1 cobalt-zinc-cadmium efflux system membrane fusion protein [Duganella sp. BK701]SEN04669.1 membrane fusion protein, cobalt-zinc-cadmium efflux system [Duganella sp. CF402]